MECFYADHFVLPLPDDHPFPMAKYRLLRDRVAGWAGAGFQLREAPPAPLAALEAVHDPAYVHAVMDGSVDERILRRIGFPWSPWMAERSRRTVGASLAAARRALEAGGAVNLAGGTHHAHFARGGGYCVFNDLAVTAIDVLTSGRVSRVAVIDLDVHHGDGTASLLGDDERVFTFSMHGERIYPAVKPPGALDIALPAGTDDAAYLAALRPALERVFEDFRPDLVLYQAGADPYSGDQLGYLDLTVAGLAQRDRLVFDWCSRRSTPVVVTMGGGYAREVDDIVRIHANTVRLAGVLDEGASLRPRARAASAGQPRQAV